MTMFSGEKAFPKSIQLLSPVIGSIVFVLCYVVAAFLYPGGSQAGAGNGFSWVHNYWCNLLAETAVNGAPNPARPVAIAGMAVLVTAVMSFWYIYSGHAALKKLQQRLIRFAGTASMLAVIFLSSACHDTVINISASFGLIAMVAIMKSLHDLGWKKLFYAGTGIPVLVGANNLLYYNPDLIAYLPVVQEITFLYFLSWMSAVTVVIYNSREEPKPES